MAQATVELTDAQLAMSSPAGYAYEISGRKWVPAAHLLLLSKALSDVAARRIDRLAIEMPPRHGKSQLASQYFPAWYTAAWPDDQVMLASYEATFAASWGAKARDARLEGEQRGLFDTRIDGGENASASGWSVVGHAGGMVTAGIGGALTGKGARVLMIDDPVKNAEEAQSKTIRDKHWDWYTSTAFTRLTPDGAVVLTMTRWHEDDLMGRVLQHEGAKWTVLRLPALADGLGADGRTAAADPLGREDGAPLWPQRYGEARLAAIREVLGGYWWSALYQQRPQPAGGSVFKRSWFRYFAQDGAYYVLTQPDGQAKRFEAAKCWLFQCCDPAATEGESSDYFVVSTWAVTPERDLLLLDVFRERADTVKHQAIMRQQFERHRPRFVKVEKRTFGLNIIGDMRRQGLPVRPAPADVDKVSRSRPVSARYEVGAVYHLQGAAWLAAWEEELVAFPNGAHDDQVDTASMAGIELAESHRIGPLDKPSGW